VQDKILRLFGRTALLRRPRIQGRAAALPYREREEIFQAQSKFGHAILLDMQDGTGNSIFKMHKPDNGINESARIARRSALSHWTTIPGIRGWRGSGLLLALGVIVSIFAWTGCSRRPQPGAGNGTAETIKVARRQFATTVSAIGMVKPQIGAEVRVGSRVSGRVSRLYANINDTVHKGQVIAEVEKADLETSVAEREAEVGSAEARLAALDVLLPLDIAKSEAEVAKCAATVTLATKDQARQLELLGARIASQAAVEQAQERLAVAEAALGAARKTLDLVQAQYSENRKQAQAEVVRDRCSLTNAQVLLSFATITAPISGVIASVATQEGETVAAGLNAPTFVNIIDLGRLQVLAYVDEVDIGKIKVGQHVVFTVDAFPANDFEGKVAAIHPSATVQENVVKYVVGVQIITPYEGQLRPEMTASVILQLEARNVLAIPARAVQREGGRHIVMACVNGRPEPREVRLGWKDGPWTEVAGGLEEGQEIFAEPAAKENGNER